MTNKHMKSVVEFDAFLNEPPSYEGVITVREFRHEAYREWLKVSTDIDRLREALKAARAELDVLIDEGKRGIAGLPLSIEESFARIEHAESVAKQIDALREE